MMILLARPLATVAIADPPFGDPPPDSLSPEKPDADDDDSSDLMTQSPSGGDSSGDQPGQVFVSSGSNGDLNNDGSDDIIIGAPGDVNGDGRVYIFFGPFISSEPITIEAANANVVLQSPDPGVEHFGAIVNKVGDFTNDATPEIRVQAWVNDNGNDITKTYVFDGVTDELRYKITGDFPFDPWMDIGPFGDADGDFNGDQIVDDLDTEIIWNYFEFNAYNFYMNFLMIPTIGEFHPPCIASLGPIWIPVNVEQICPGGGGLPGEVAGSRQTFPDLARTRSNLAPSRPNGGKAICLRVIPAIAVMVGKFKLSMPARGTTGTVSLVVGIGSETVASIIGLMMIHRIPTGKSESTSGSCITFGVPTKDVPIRVR